MFKIILIFSCCWLLASSCSSTIPSPDISSNIDTLTNKEKNPHLPRYSNPLETSYVDGELQNWLASHANRPALFEMDETLFDEFVKKQDPLTAAFLNLRWSKSKNLDVKESLTVAIDAVNANSNFWMTSTKSSIHPLSPYILQEILSTKDLEDKTREKMSELLNSLAPQSCPAQRLLYQDMEANKIQSKSTAELKRIINKINTFHRLNLKAKLLEKFINSLSEEQTQKILIELAEVSQGFLDLLERHPWLKKQEKEDRTADFTLFASAQKMARTKRCNTAQSSLLLAIEKFRTEDKLPDALATADAIAGCYRRENSKNIVQFWELMATQLEETYGFGGFAVPKIKIATIYWNTDEYSTAINLLEDVYNKAEIEGAKQYQAEAVYRLARIHENTGNEQKAEKYYREYLSEFKDEKEYDDSLRFMILLKFKNKQYQEALNYAHEIVKKQINLQQDERSLGIYSFALFWAGRMHYLLGEEMIATMMWEKLATQYYSTFYGMLGHYLLEKSNNSIFLPITMDNRTSFTPEDLYAPFIEEDRVKVKRVESLLTLGMKKEAKCEIAEIDISDDIKEKKWIVSLLLFATNEWLEAVKVFHRLPLSYRHILPPGAERIIFPESYESQIWQYSKRLDLDPFFAIALIRQESVFNPRAMSSAGAMGLMQLMPKTALTELKKMGNEYMPAEKRRETAENLRSISRLFDTNTNLAIGMHHLARLLKTYDNNPIYILSAYNASPQAIERWRKNISTDDWLFFIEKIPYRETEMYIKLVLRNYFYYSRWYSKTPPPLPYLELLGNSLMPEKRHPNSGPFKKDIDNFKPAYVRQN